MGKLKLLDCIQPDLQPDLEPENLARYLTKARPKKKKAHHGPTKILRTETYRGHDVKIETTYKITVDGKAVNGHFDVTNSGHVHYHPLPNRSSSSAIDMVRAIIDSFPDDFPSSKSGRAGKGKTSSKKRTGTRKTRAKRGKKKRKKSSGS